MDLELQGKRVIVAGASRGIGKAIAVALAHEGARVAAVARGKDDLAALDLPGHGHVTLVADVSTADGAASALERAVTAFDGLDAAVAVAGKSFARKVAEMDDADLARSLEVNLWSSAWIARGALPHLRAAGGGAIVLISSIWGREAGGAPGYNVAKAGVIALAKALAGEVAAEGIRVNSVAPGSIWFPGGGWDRRVQADPDAMAAFVAREIPAGRFGTPEEVADVVTFLCSPRARWINGACVVVDGGQSRAF
jgi:3-oxoacyl-[acyl-carrier protein] reductase